VLIFVYLFFSILYLGYSMDMVYNIIEERWTLFWQSTVRYGWG